MNVLEKRITTRRPGRNTYIVKVDVWTDTPKNRETVIDYCDRNNFGGCVIWASKQPDGYNVMVDVYTD